MRNFLAATILLVLAVPAMAVDYYARGTFGLTTNPWDDLSYQMQPDPLHPTHYSVTAGGFFPNVPYDFKIATSDFTTAVYPTTNSRITTDSNGEMTFHLYTNGGNAWTDGYLPNNTARVGYNDPGQFGWEVAGSFNNWPADNDPNYNMTSQGNGVYTLTKTFDANPTAYQYKFRQQGSWDTNIGADFGNNAPNNSFRVWDNGETWTFTLDLQKGRFQATTTSPNPDPTNDGNVNLADYVTIRKSNNTPAAYQRFRQHFGETPPPPDTSTFYARGDWNGFDLSDPMDNNGGGLYTHTETGLTPGQFYNFKAANNNYSIEAPPHINVNAAADANGQITTRFFLNNNWTDGWEPHDQYRIGYQDPGLYGWELMGDFNGFAGGPQYVMQNEGGGLYSVVVNLAATASGDTDGYGFKFRRYDPTNGGNWNTNIGATFGNGGDNAQTGVLAAGNYKFELDLFNGRWRVSPVTGGEMSLVPEPTSLATGMLAMALFGMLRRRGQR